MAEKPAGPTPRTRARGGLASSAPSSRRLSSISYTATLNQTKKVPDPKVVRTTRATPAKKRPQVDQAQKRREELAALQEQLSGLQRKLLEKDEALRSAENLIGRISAANEAVDELRGQLSEKESLIEYTGSELHGAKVMLAEKQAALEKLEWEAKVSNTKVEELQVDVASMDVEVSALMKLFRKITENDQAPYPRDRKDDSSLECEPIQLDDTVGDFDTEKMEQEMSAYISALAAAKENPTDEFLKAVTEARLRLQAFVL
ncbi:protein MICROTUBULE BINDING PROTEIN 2C-like [Phragmites australis]|uniref:protein MICROTUBULE BINDING PROTEIN 2C-like n=1 Tax=Phragmites australis TaxID=29695 RepID=UPI002D76601A|nr:protein MICROTUBULE BINDING PROTEIN 2C-like [Phragmites australis]